MVKYHGPVAMWTVRYSVYVCSLAGAEYRDDVWGDCGKEVN